MISADVGTWSLGDHRPQFENACGQLATILRALGPTRCARVWAQAQAELARFGFESNRIEGNAMSWAASQDVVSGSRTAGSQAISEVIEQVNHLRASEAMLWRAKLGIEPSLGCILDTHAVLRAGLDPCIDRYRTQPMHMHESSYQPPAPQHVPGLMESALQAYRETTRAHPLLRSCYLHYALVAIHPFLESSGRTARITMNQSLLASGLPIVVLSGDEAEKNEYFSALRKVDAGVGLGAFALFVAERCVAQALQLG